MVPLSRRTFLRTTAFTATFGIAGCSGDVESNEPIPGDRYPKIHDWLRGRVGAPANTYHDTLADHTGQDSLTIEVGSRGNSGYLSYKPTGVVVSVGTTITFSWTGRGGAHNVVAEQQTELGSTAYAFDSGDPERGSSVTFQVTMDHPGIALYDCTPHWTFGMKGAIAVK